tara:strand:- start:760 stop:1770 length:1011 start_codon:yes stop_codon:yes gene_type:complete
MAAVLLVVGGCFCLVSSAGLGYLASTDYEELPEEIKDNLPDPAKKALYGQDAALAREYGEISDDVKKARSESAEARRNVGQKRSEEQQKEAELREAARKLQEAEDEAAKVAAAEELRKKAEEARLAEEARQRAEAEAEKKRQEELEAQREAQRKAQQLANLKKGCKDVTWENVYVGGRPGRDISFWDRTSITTSGQTITKGNKKITTDRSSGHTVVQENQMTGRDRRGRPTYTWRNKASYDGYIGIKGKEVGWVAMNKAPSNKQSMTCKTYGRSCRYEPGDFNTLHTFSDSLLKFVVVNNHMGVMQGKTGKFYSIPDKKVMDNPLSSDCKTKLDYK